MKSLICILACVCLGGWAYTNFFTSSFEVPSEGITFHKVQLVCGAAPDIGCGSRSKPILLDLQQEESIKEAWLNRAGTIVAVVWNTDLEPNTDAVLTIFKRHGKSIKTIKGNEYTTQLKSFKNDQWYQGADVDQLSMEEAGRIAKQIIDQLLADEVLSKENAPEMHAEVEQYIQNEFLILEDVSLLNTAAYYENWENNIRKIGEKYIPADEMPEIETGTPSSFSCRKGVEQCCAKGKANCCKKKDY